jgi:hypothetical protein
MTEGHGDGMDAQDSDPGGNFECLWLLRASYPHRSDYDIRVTLSVPEAIAYGEQLLRRTSARDQWRRFGQTHRAA